MAAKEMGEKQIFAITIVLFVAALLVVTTFIFLSYRRMDKLNAETRQLARQYADYKVIADRQPKAEQDLRDCKARLEDCKQYLPNEENVQRMLDDLTKSCQSSDLESVEIKMDTAPVTALRPGAVKPQYETIRYRAEFRGTFHQMAHFISQVENWKQFKRFVNISAYSVEAAAKGTTFDNSRQKHKIKMTLELYKYQEPAAAPALTGPGAPAPAPAG